MRARPSSSTSAKRVIALGGTLDYLVDTVFNYPTLAEAYKVAALDAYNRLRRREGNVRRAGTRQGERRLIGYREPQASSNPKPICNIHWRICGPAPQYSCSSSVLNCGCTAFHAYIQSMPSFARSKSCSRGA